MFSSKEDSTDTSSPLDVQADGEAVLCFDSAVPHTLAAVTGPSAYMQGTESGATVEAGAEAGADTWGEAGAITARTETSAGARAGAGATATAGAGTKTGAETWGEIVTKVWDEVTAEAWRGRRRDMW